ncbi:dephospho-CoA kinase, partial [bacterium]|nr:dephospho-CoA kinase [bacterium]
MDDSLPTSRLRVFALTGGIACGKSTVLEMLRQRNFRVVSADTLSREVVAPGSPGLEQVIAHFGSEYLSPEGSLLREKLGQLIFRDPQKRAALEAILHPLIRRAAQDAISRIQAEALQGESTRPRGIIYEIPLYFETGGERPFHEIDTVVVVACSEAEMEARLQSRNGLNREQARERISTQIPIAEKVARADYTIQNSGSREALTGELESFLSFCEHLPPLQEDHSVIALRAKFSED